jgi:hypothetical protein
MSAVLTGLVLALLLVSFSLWRLRQARRREQHIRSFAFPRGTFAKVIAQHPHLSDKDMALVAQGLRQFFLAYLKSGRRYVSMPSQLADALWHEFILHTRSYQDFTQRAFGNFLHHSPAVELGAQQRSNEGLRRCWRHACQEEHINPRQPSRLPLLFALDAKFKIDRGFVYQVDCDGVRRAEGQGGSTVHCGADFSDASFEGGTAGWRDGGDGTGSDSGSDGGCDGGGCGGGCGGGGD